MIGLKRIISQNNFFFDHQITVPSGAHSKGENSAAEISMLAGKSIIPQSGKHLGTELSEPVHPK
jgi:hypothetical protein